MSLTIAEVAALSAGALSNVSDATLRVTGPVVADSRRVVPGCLFVALPGAHVDGHKFVAQATAAGAALVLADHDVGLPAVVVDDTLRALGRLASGYLSTLPAPLVIGITGSSGKTSTKDITAQVLSAAGPTVAPEGSFNTEVGVPLTVMRADDETRHLVLELSARGLGHIAYLCELVHPQIGVVLNVGTAHVGEFGSSAAVARAKGELVESLPANGVAVLNGDDEAVSAMSLRTAARVVRFGTANDCDVRASQLRLDALARPTFVLSARGVDVEVTLALHGGHQASNALAAAAVGLEAGLDLDTIAATLRQVRPLSRWRMQVDVRPDGATVVNDAYNANPESMRAALEALAAMGSTAADRRTYAVLGEMAELGMHSVAAHRNIGAAAALLGVHGLVVVGPSAREIANGAIASGLDSAAVICVDDVDAAIEHLNATLRSGDVVLVKASRSANLQRVAEALLASTTASGVMQ